MKALILDGKVVDVNEKEFEVHSSMSWVDCDEKVSVGWTYDGSTFKTNEVTPTAEEELEQLRAKRNIKLAETDWMSLPDAPTMSDAWKKYRQELRDITKTYKTLDDVKWPTEPS